MEIPPQTVIDAGSVQVNRFSLTPGGELYRQLLPGARFVGAEPSLFTTGGPLPPFIASGVDRSELKLCAWYLRHSGAYTPRRSHLLAIIEESANPDFGPDLERLQTTEGTDGLRSYLSRVGTWVSRLPDTESVGSLDYDAVENDPNLFPQQQM
jgi:hypothetical protein